MLTISELRNAVEEQFLHNQDKSLYFEQSDGRPVLKPSHRMRELLKHKSDELSAFLQSAIADGSDRELARNLSEKTIHTFMKTNQYLNFSPEDFRKLETIYRELFRTICSMAKQTRIKDRDIDRMFAGHYQRLKSFLAASNGTEIFEKYKEHPVVPKITCSEYSAEFQMQLLEIDVQSLKQPVLDLGCGRRADLVRYLRQHDIEAYGVDRHAANHRYLYRINWFEFSLRPESWGTIISHMAFSNHFHHQHLRADGDYERYARKYMELLYALRPGGSFVYAPRVPFFEEVLIKSSESFVVHTGIHAAKVTRKTS